MLINPTESHSGAFSGEDKYEHGEELGQRGANGVGMARLAGIADCNIVDCHGLQNDCF